MTTRPAPTDARTVAVGKAICAEACAHMGEPPCWSVRDNDGNLYAWPPATCDEPGCIWLAAAAVAALPETPPEDPR